MSQLLWGTGQWGVDTWATDNEGLALGGHRFRLLVRWYDREDLFPTYWTVKEREDTYASILANYTSYQDLLDNIGGGVELDVDLTCDVAGITSRAGRNSITEHVRASEMNFTLLDPDGEHDPRRTPIAARSRIGARLRLEARPNGGPWRPILTTWVDSWRKDLAPEEKTVDVTSADALKMLARAKPTEGDPAGAAETAAARFNRVLDDIPWNIKWGATMVGYSSSWSQLNPIAWDGATSALDHLHDCYTVEDGLLWVDGYGTLHAEGRDWRSQRNYTLGIDLVPNNIDDPWGTTPDAVVCPTSLTSDDNDLDIVNAATVWRSVDYDPDLPSGDRPDVVRRNAQDTASISYYGEHRETLGDLPALSNTRTQEIANTWVARYKDGAQDIGEAQFDLVKRPQDAEPILNLKWGDTVVVRDDVNGYLETVHEVIGVRHNITPYRWEATVTLDRKVS